MKDGVSAETVTTQTDKCYFHDSKELFTTTYLEFYNKHNVRAYKKMN